MAEFPELNELHAVLGLIIAIGGAWWAYRRWKDRADKKVIEEHEQKESIKDLNESLEKSTAALEESSSQIAKNNEKITELDNELKGTKKRIKRIKKSVKELPKDEENIRRLEATLTTHMNEDTKNFDRLFERTGEMRETLNTINISLAKLHTRMKRLTKKAKQS